MALTLNKQTVNLVIDQGTTFEKVITAKNTAGGNVAISSGTCAGKLRPSHYTSIMQSLLLVQMQGQM